MTNGSEHIPEATNYQKLAQDLRTLGGEGFMATDQYSRVPYGFLYRAADAVESLLAENARLRENRGWDGEWRTLGQTEEEARRILMHWTKAQLVNAHVADWQRKVQNENWVADRLVKITAERDALQAQLDAMTVERANFASLNKGGRLIQIPRQRLVSEWTVVEGDQS